MDFGLDENYSGKQMFSDIRVAILTIFFFLQCPISDLIITYFDRRILAINQQTRTLHRRTSSIDQLRCFETVFLYCLPERTECYACSPIQKVLEY